VKVFNFGEQTAAVFDDMLHRSVPFYGEVQRMMGEIAADFAVEGTNVYDLGCSTCNTFIALDPVIKPGVRFVGVDSSSDMLKRARAKLAEAGVARECDLQCADLNEGVQVTNASVVILNLTLQFVRPLYRHKLIASIAQGMRKDGALLLVEKVLCKDSMLNRFFIKYYYAFKQRNGYSDLEISQKREALENVLVPYRLEENIELLLSGGFSQCDVFFKWYNFCGLIALK
jgi:tRNA (cmo5U34)-methyltransferase